MNKVCVFDIDGTLFPHGYDLFFNTMQNALGDISAVEAFFKKGKTINAAERALAYCREHLMELHGESFERVLEDVGATLCASLFDNGEYHPAGFNEIKTAIAIGHDVYLSTANVQPIVKGVVSVMSDKGMLPAGVKVLCSTWDSNGIFANIAENKIVSLEMATGKRVFDMDVIFYCDDVNGNDKGLAELAAWTYVIDGKHNKKDTLPGNAVRLNWEKYTQAAEKRGAKKISPVNYLYYYQ